MQAAAAAVDADRAAVAGAVAAGVAVDVVVDREG